MKLFHTFDIFSFKSTNHIFINFNQVCELYLKRGKCMNKFKHSEAVSVIEKELNRHGIKCSNIDSRNLGYDIVADLPNGRELKIIVRVISSLGGYTFVRQNKFDVSDSNLVLAVLYLQNIQVNEIYFFPASAWSGGNYPFVYYPYDNPELISLPEYGITFSQKTIDLISRFKSPACIPIMFS